MVGRFMEAFIAGDIDGLMSLLAEDVTVWSDSGGKVSGAARRPVQGRDKVARGIVGLLPRAPAGTTVEVIEANGLPALLMRVKGQSEYLNMAGNLTWLGLALFVAYGKLVA